MVLVSLEMRVSVTQSNGLELDVKYLSVMKAVEDAVLETALLLKLVNVTLVGPENIVLLVSCNTSYYLFFFSCL